MGCSSKNLGPQEMLLLLYYNPKITQGVQTVTGTAELTNQQPRQPVAYQLLLVTGCRGCCYIILYTISNNNNKTTSMFCRAHK